MLQDCIAQVQHLMIRKRYKLLAIWLTIGLVAFLGAIYGFYRYNYPHGYSHCCLKALGLALESYALRNGGHFPAGAGCPEASLSLLNGEKYGVGAETLRGKTVALDKVKAILERGELLGPDSCDWHYVEGLTLSDNSRLALVWDKVGLGHNGERLSGGGHSVWFVGPIEEIIPDSQWPQFLAEQEELMAARTEAAKKGLPALTARIRLPSGDIVDHFDASYSLQESYSTPSGNGGSQSSSGARLDASALRWNRVTPDEATLTFILSFNGWESKPVTIHVSKGVPNPDCAVFDMQGQQKKVD
jgi:hypothetical protein